jgi:uncharacterized protein YwqG
MAREGGLVRTDDVVRQLEPWRAKYRRAAWKPVVRAEDGPTTESKFSGTPWIGEGAPWPRCRVCRQPLQLFLQLNLEALPAELGSTFGTGLLQLFYCTNEACAGEGGWEPFADDLSRARIVQPNGPSGQALVPTREGSFPARRIVGWQPLSDLPSPAEHDSLGLVYKYDHKAGTTRLECAALGLVFDNLRDEMLAETVANAADGDKLGGWPSWVQGPEYPNCARCMRGMDLVFQVDSNDNLPFMFGDAGCGHITQCAEHKDVVAFGWACS